MKDKKNEIFLVFLLAFALVLGSVLNFNSNQNISINTSGIDLDNGDKKINWSKYSIFDVDLSESFTIQNSGIYHLSGVLNGMITVDVGNDVGVCKIILDNVSIFNETGPAIYIRSANDIVIETAKNSFNKLVSGDFFEGFEDEKVNGVIYSKGDLSFYGAGELYVESNYEDAIVSKDDLAIRSGEIKIKSVDDGIRGKDSVYITGGVLEIEAKQDGIKSTNDEKTTKGFVYIDDGDIKISAGDDGIHATTGLYVNSGTINILSSYEGMEGAKVIINGGDIGIKSIDDGINAAGGRDNSAFSRPGKKNFSSDTSYIISINGGNVYINASGDGLDSNGVIYINGGNIVVDGPTNSANGALDSENGIFFNGGSIFAVSASGMAEGFEDNSASFGVNVFLDNYQTKNTNIVVKDEDGYEVFSHVSAKTFDNITFGSEKLKKNATYVLYLNGEGIEEFTLFDNQTDVGSKKGFIEGFDDNIGPQRDAPSMPFNEKGGGRGQSGRK